MNILKRTFIFLLCIIITFSFISCSKESKNEINVNDAPASTTYETEPAVESDWLYQGFWLYSIGGGEDTDVFVFQFLDEQTFNFTSYYAVTETEFDSEPVFSKEKYLVSTDKKFGIFVGNDWHFAFDNDKGKLYVRTSESLYDEVLNYDEVTNKTLNDCYNTYNRTDKYINIEIDDSSAEYDLNDIALDYTAGKENINGNPTSNPAESIITYQDSYYYFFDGNNNIRKVKENELENGNYSLALYPEFTMNFSYVYSVSVMKNYIYFSAYGDNGYGLYAMPTTYISEIQPFMVSQIYSSSFFISNGKLYYLNSEQISSSSEKVFLCCRDPDKNSESRICEIGTSKEDVSVYLDYVCDGYAYATVKDPNLSDYGFKYLKIDLLNGNAVEVLPDGYAAHGFPFYNDGKIYYIIWSNTDFLVDADYFVVDFENNKTEHINPGSSLSWSWKLVTIMDDYALMCGSSDPLGTYVVPLDNIKEVADYNSESLNNAILPKSFSGEDIGTKLTDDSIDTNSAYLFGDIIFYVTGSYEHETLNKINIDGSSWGEVADLSSYEN